MDIKRVRRFGVRVYIHRSLSLLGLEHQEYVTRKAFKLCVQKDTITCSSLVLAIFKNMCNICSGGPAGPSSPSLLAQTYVETFILFYSILFL